MNLISLDYSIVESVVQEFLLKKNLSIVKMEKLIVMFTITVIIHPIGTAQKKLSEKKI